MEISGQYLTFSEYTALGGTLDQNSFSLLEHNARMKIDERTFGRLKDIQTQPQDVKLCVFKLINTLNGYNTYTESDKNVASENIDGYSVSYVGANKSITEAMNKEIEDTINAYLCNVTVDNIPVLYRGVK